MAKIPPQQLIDMFLARKVSGDFSCLNVIPFWILDCGFYILDCKSLLEAMVSIYDLSHPLFKLVLLPAFLAVVCVRTLPWRSRVTVA
ncbi:MAG: hypothetical protein KME25_05630 [Symplocastrum torsivum CPER-KK1]|jgi:hypothetical protein|uniref:Uncharacterized protein n=1 Tax=Symplocastrum torsivum CPER-KK1 TaxID=450513 RepID=A0A951PJB0_9CYAN|nr:hypothetical protein [Symplocastrum torsivum CPER-KK1]